MSKNMIAMKLNFFGEDSQAAEAGAAAQEGKAAGADTAGGDSGSAKEQAAAVPAAEDGAAHQEKDDGGKPDAEAELKAREAKVLAGELRIKAHGTLAEKGLDPRLLDVLIYTDAESCDKSIAALETVIKAAVDKAVAEKERIRESVPKAATGIPPADAGFKSAVEAHIKKSGIV